MNAFVKSVFVVLAVGSFSCQDKSTVSPAPTTGVISNTAFADGQSGWEAEFTDYGPEQEEIIEFSSAYTNLPSPLDSTRKALSLTLALE